MNYGEYKVYLRAFESDDYSTTHAWRKDDETWSMVVGRKYYVSSEYEKKWINDAIIYNQDNIRLAVCLKDTDELIGIVSLIDIDWFNRNAGIGVMIGQKDYRGKDYASQAARLILYHGFFDLGLERISAEFLNSNPITATLGVKARFKQEGILRHAVYKNGKYEDLVVVSILKDEFMALINNNNNAEG